MDVLFINAQDALELRKEVNGQLILGTLLLQADFDVDILRFCQVEGFKGDYELFIHNMIQKILTYEPKAVSFYSLWPDYHIMLRIAKKLKKIRPEIYIVFGGPQPSSTAIETLEAMPYIDFICSGEGENTVVPFFTALLRNNSIGLDSIPGLYYRENNKIIHHNNEHPLCDLNTLPYWDDRLFLKYYEDGHEDYQSKSYYMPIDAGRGCPYSCTFCCTSHFWLRTYRLKTPERIIQDIQYFKEKFGINSFWFSHDAFTTSKTLVNEVCHKMTSSNLNINWKCTARADCISEELIIKMQQAGMDQIELGVETGSKRMQKLIKKNLNLSMLDQIVTYLISRKIKVSLFFMYAFPEETESDLNDTLELIFKLIDNGVQYIGMNYCRFSPLTDITLTHINNLVYEPQIKVLARYINGYENEIKTISNNKHLFPFYYHLSTHVRDNFQFIHYLVKLYNQNPKVMKYVRSLYAGDNIKLYKDFYENNSNIFSGDMDTAHDEIKYNFNTIITRTIANISCCHLDVLLSIINLEKKISDLKSSSNPNESYFEKLPFNYKAYHQNEAIEIIVKTNSIIRIKKENNKLSIAYHSL